MLANYSFDRNGIMSPEATRILDSGFLVSMSKCLGKKVVDLDEEIFKGVYAKDILESSVVGSLSQLMDKVYEENPKMKCVEINDMQLGSII